MLRRLGLGTALLAAIGVTAALLTSPVLGAAARPTAPVAAKAPAKEHVLTRWRKVGWWAHILRPALVHALPRARSRVVGKLHYQTEDGYPEVYQVLSKRVMPNGQKWVKIALPMRPNGTTGWVPRVHLGKLQRVPRWLFIDRRKLRARFFENGRQIWSAPVGIGKPSTPTPRGLFWVREQFQLLSQPFYGPYAFGTSAYARISDWPGGGVVGLHGTSLPHLVPGRPSHGCIRLHNSDVLWLAYHMPVGTPISVIN